MSRISCQIRKLSGRTTVASNGLGKADKTVSALIRITTPKDLNASNMFKPRSSQFWIFFKLHWSALEDAKEPILNFKKQQNVIQGKNQALTKYCLIIDHVSSISLTLPCISELF